MPGKLDSFKALSAQDKRHAVVNWLLDHAMIIIILLLAVYVQIQRPQFFGVPSLVNIISLTAARLPMALGVAGCIVLAGTDLTGGRVAGLTAFVAAILLQKSPSGSGRMPAASPKSPVTPWSRESKPAPRNSLSAPPPSPMPCPAAR